MGGVIVEAALVLPLLLLVVFAALEFGRAVQIMQTLDSVAREGARYAALPAAGSSTLPADVASKVEGWAADAGVALTDSEVAVNASASESGQADTFSQVDVSYTYSFITPILAEIIPSVTLHGHAIMRNETN